MSEPASNEAIFHAALGLSTVEDRDTYLNLACNGDTVRRDRIERLLNAHLRAGEFLERPVGTVSKPADDADPDWPEHEQSLEFLAKSSRPDSLGRLGHYEILNVIGEGGMGLVLRAFDERLKRVVAIKALRPELAAISAARKRFVREACVAASVIHENMVAIHAVEDGGSVPYLVMAYVEGHTLQQKLDQEGPTSVEMILQIGIQIADGLGAAHAQGLIHRDVKPANILLEAVTERVKITDFGLARCVDDPGASHPGLIAGTPAYMSPEQANGKYLDQRSDLFGLGSLLYALCVGQAPFQGPTMPAVLRQVCDHHPRPVRELNPAIPIWLETLITGLLAKNPDDRPQTAVEVAQLLRLHRERVQTSHPIAETSVVSPSKPPFIRIGFWSRWLLAMAAICLLGALFGVTEATGVTDLGGTVIRFFSSEGILVVEVEDPDVSVSLDGSELVITGAGVREILLTAGTHALKASKDGKIVRQERVTITRNGRQVLRISQEPIREDRETTGTPPLVTDWERWVATLPINQRVEAVVSRLKELNPGLSDPTFKSSLDMAISSPKLKDLSPLRALPGLQRLFVNAPNLTDLSPLRGMEIVRLELFFTGVTDLSPLQGMSLVFLDLSGSKRVTDLSPLRGMKFKQLTIAYTGVTDLGPLRGTKLKLLNCDSTQVKDLAPIQDLPLDTLWIQNTPVKDLAPIVKMPLHRLNLEGSAVTDLSPIATMAIEKINCDFDASRDEAILRAMPSLKIINNRPASEFWADVDSGKVGGDS